MTPAARHISPGPVRHRDGSRITTYGYDADNRMTSTIYSSSSTPSVTAATYDNDGRRLTVTENHSVGTSTWTYDSLGDVLSSQLASGSTVSYGYDAKGNETTISYPGAANPVLQCYDEADRIVKIYDWGVSGATCSTSGGNAFSYDYDSNLVSSAYANGVTDSRTYDNDDSMTQTQTAKGATVYGTLAYTRNAAEQLASTATSGTNLAPSGTESYGYNSLQQLSGTSGASSLTYGYDSGDNPTQLNGAYQAFDSADELCWQNTTSSANPCSTPPTGATTYSYDAEGNRHTQTVASTTTTYTYDQQNRLSSVSGGATASYTYMADGTRISKTTGGVTTNFTYSSDGGTPRLLLTSGGGVTAKYLYGPDGNVFEQKVGTPTTYLSDDQLGSVRVVTDNAGNDVGTYNYDPYGNTTSHTGTASALEYAGQYLDTETGYYYLQARYYEPTTGQFTTRDPAYDETLDPYGYVGDSPLNGTDPLGLYWGQGFVHKVTHTATSTWNSTGGKVVHVVKQGATAAYHYCTSGLEDGAQCVAIASGVISGGASLAALGASEGTFLGVAGTYWGTTADIFGAAGTASSTTLATIDCRNSLDSTCAGDIGSALLGGSAYFGSGAAKAASEAGEYIGWYTLTRGYTELGLWDLGRGLGDLYPSGEGPSDLAAETSFGAYVSCFG